MSKIVELVIPPPGHSDDTVKCLQRLLEQAKAGEITGVAFCAILRRRKYIVDTAGTARRYPTFTRGMVAALDDELSRQVRGEANS